MSDILEKILAVKHDEVAAAKNAAPPSWNARARLRSSTRDFEGALRAKKPAVIAEIKRRVLARACCARTSSPAIARSYAEAGAACLSVLTDREFFQGTADYLNRPRAACELPVLRKDFMIDPYQAFEARAMGADCVLLIVACLDDAQMRELRKPWRMAGHGGAGGGARCRRAGARARASDPLIGINNRNLRTFETRLRNRLDLLPRIPAERA